MRKRVGLAIAHDTLRAVVVKGNKLLWAAETSREPGPPIAGDIVALFARAPLPRWRRTPLVVAVGPHASQLKRIAGLPPVQDLGILAAVVRQNASTFFLQNGVPLAVTGIRTAEPATFWAGAIESTHVACVRQACRRSHLKLCAIAPAAVVLPTAILNDCFHWTDGPVTLEITRTAAQLTSVRRVAAVAGNGATPPDPIPALHRLAESAVRFADAYGAAIAGVGDPLTLGPQGDVPWERRRLRRRLLPPLLLAMLAIGALLLSPLYSVTVARSAEASLRELQASAGYRLAGEVLPQLERATAVLAELERFAATRSERTGLLARLAASLPERTAIVHLNLRNSETRMVVVTPSAPEVLSALEQVPGITLVTQEAQIARQNIAGTDFERVTFTFQYRATAAAGSAKK